MHAHTHAPDAPSPCTAGVEAQALPLAVYALQLALNFAWTPLFFSAHALGAATADILGELAGETGCAHAPAVRACVLLAHAQEQPCRLQHAHTNAALISHARRRRRWCNTRPPTPCPAAAAMWVAIAATIALFGRVIGAPLALGLLGPYLLWVSYASALTIWIWRFNPRQVHTYIHTYIH